MTCELLGSLVNYCEDDSTIMIVVGLMFELIVAMKQMCLCYRITTKMRWICCYKCSSCSWLASDDIHYYCDSINASEIIPALHKIL